MISQNLQQNCFLIYFQWKCGAGRTFDVAYRFFEEDPWDRLLSFRKKAPNVLLQMLLRASNAVGYKNYPDNVIREFVEKSADAGVDDFPYLSIGLN